MKEIAIEGVDGSGKTTVAHELARHYSKQGMQARVVSPYVLANEYHGSDIYELWQSEQGRLEAVDILKYIFSHETNRAQSDGIEVLIFDRHWMTAFTEIAGDEHAVSAWGDTFVPTAYLRVAAHLAHTRSQNDTDEAWMTKQAHQEYANQYESLCRTFGKHVLGIYRNDEDVTLAMLVASIEWDVNIRR